jgi:hypothetical protein
MIDLISDILAQLFPLVVFGVCWWPCCTSVDCDVCSDDFNRSDGTDITTGSACGWTEESGAWSISSNALSTASTSAAAICSTASTSAARVINVKASGNTNGCAARVIVGYVNSTTYWIVQVTFHATTGSLTISERSGGSPTTRATVGNLALPLSTLHQIQVCYDGTSLEARIAGIDSAYLTFPASISDLDSGLGTGTGSGTVKFDDWQLRLRDGSCSCPITPTTVTECSGGCIDGDAATFYEVEIDGVGDGTCTCSDYNGVWVVSQTDFSSDSAGTCCRWKYDMASTMCSPALAQQVWLEMCRTVGPAFLRVRVACIAGGSSPLNCEKDFTYPYDCLSFSAEPLDDKAAFDTKCSGTMSATVTAL